MTYAICKDFTFSAAHRLPDHRGECRHLHGHNYRLRVTVEAEELDELGMVIDFKRLKELLQAIAGRFDHRVLNEQPPFDKISPTAELIAEHVCRSLAERLGDDRLRVRRVEVWETERSCAIFEP